MIQTSKATRLKLLTLTEHAIQTVAIRICTPPEYAELMTIVQRDIEARRRRIEGPARKPGHHQYGKENA